MNTQINLALEKEGIKKATQKYFYAVVIAFVIVVLITLSLLTYNFLLGRQFEELLDDKQTITDSIKTQEEKKAKLLLLKERLSAIETVIKSREKLPGRLLDILNMMPTTLSIEEADISGNKVLLTINSNNLKDIDTFLSLLHELKPGLLSIKQTELETFGIDNNKLVYNFELEFGY